MATSERRCRWCYRCFEVGEHDARFLCLDCWGWVTKLGRTGERNLSFHPPSRATFRAHETLARKLDRLPDVKATGDDLSKLCVGRDWLERAACHVDRRTARFLFKHREHLGRRVDALARRLR